MAWAWVLTDLAGNALGEIQNATDRRMSLGLNRTASASCSIRLDNALTTKVFEDDRRIKVYNGSTLMFHGDVVSAELSGSGSEMPTVALNAANPAWKLSRRLINLSTGNKKYTGDKAKSARKIINELNTDTGTYPTNPETGVEVLSEGSYTGGSGEYEATPYKSALTAINDMAHTLSAFDWYISPIEYNASGKYGKFEAGSTFGSDKSSSTYFEFGGGGRIGQANVRQINFIRDLSDLTNKAFHMPSNLETESVLSEADAASITHRGRFEAVADAFGFDVTALREAWLDEFIRVKKNPRFVLTMTLDNDDGTGRVPKMGASNDYWLGDFVHVRGWLPNTAGQLFDGKVRVYGIEVEVNDAGTPTITPVFIDEEGEAL